MDSEKTYLWLCLNLYAGNRWYFLGLSDGLNGLLLDLRRLNDGLNNFNLSDHLLFRLGNNFRDCRFINDDRFNSRFVNNDGFNNRFDRSFLNNGGGDDGLSGLRQCFDRLNFFVADFLSLMKRASALGTDRV